MLQACRLEHLGIEAVTTKYTCSNGKNVAAGELLIRNY